MGNLSEPIREKVSIGDIFTDVGIFYGGSEMQGYRFSMEDGVLAKKHQIGDLSLGIFGLFDGHGGEGASQFLQKNFDNILVKNIKIPITDRDIKEAYLAIDREYKRTKSAVDDSGSTSVSAVIDGKKLYVAHSGDSRWVLSKKGEVFRQSTDHKPTNDIESKRISDAGGFVEFGRVNGSLSLSRAIGDFAFKENPDLNEKQQIITAYPDAETLEIDQAFEFLVLACDGIWDEMSSQEVVNFIRFQISKGSKLTEAIINLLDYILDGEIKRGSGDNMSCLVVAFLHGMSEDEWYTHIKNNYDSEGPFWIDERAANESINENAYVGDDIDNAYDDIDEEVSKKYENICVSDFPSASDLS